MSNQDLKDKVVVITGGNTEVAGAVALALTEQGAQVCLCGKQADLLELSAQKIKSVGGSCTTVVSELDNLDAAMSIVSTAKANYGRIDILIIVSPFWAGGQIHDHNVRTWDLVMNANLREAFLMARAVLPVFRQQQHGEIMAIGSDSALGIYEQDGAYGVAMHALSALMELIQKENQSLGIRTHVLSPAVAVTADTDAEGRPTLTTSHVAEWAIWLLTRPAHLRGNGSILI